MAKRWYYHDGTQSVGPVSATDLKRLANANAIDAETRVRPEDKEQWVKAERVKGLFATPEQAHATAHDTPSPPPIGSSQASTPNAPKKSPTGHGMPNQVTLAAGGIIAAVLVGLLIFAFVRGPGSQNAGKLAVEENERETQAVARQEGASQNENPLPQEDDSELVLQAYQILNTYPSHAVDRGLPESPKANVGNAKNLLEKFVSESGQGQTDRNSELAQRALELIEAVESEERIVQFLVNINSADPKAFEEIADERSIDVQSSIVDTFAKNFFARRNASDEQKLFRVIKRKGGGSQTRIGFSSREYGTMLEAVFFQNVYDSFGSARDIAARQREDERKRRVAARPARPPVMSSIYEVDENIARFSGKCVSFVGVWVYGDIEKQENGEYLVGVEDERGQTYRGSRSKMRFVCTKALADSIRRSFEADVKVACKIYCDLYEVTDSSTTTVFVNGRKTRNSSAKAEIYKIETLARDGSILRTIE